MGIGRWVIIFGTFLNINYGGCSRRHDPDVSLDEGGLWNRFGITIQTPDHLHKAVLPNTRPKRPEKNYVSFGKPYTYELALTKSQKKRGDGDTDRSADGNRQDEEKISPDDVSIHHETRDLAEPLELDDDTFLETLVLRPSTSVQEKDFGLSRMAPTLSIRPTLALKPTLTLLHLLSGPKYSPTLLLKPTYAVKPTLTIKPLSNFKHHMIPSPGTEFSDAESIQETKISDNIPVNDDGDTTFSDLIISALQTTSSKLNSEVIADSSTVTNREHALPKIGLPLTSIIFTPQHNLTALNQHKERILLLENRPASFNKQQHYNTQQVQQQQKPNFKAHLDTAPELNNANKNKLPVAQNRPAKHTSVVEVNTTPVNKKRPMLSQKPVNMQGPQVFKNQFTDQNRPFLMKQNHYQLNSKSPSLLQYRPSLHLSKIKPLLHQTTSKPIIYESKPSSDTNVDEADNDIGLETLLDLDGDTSSQQTHNFFNLIGPEAVEENFELQKPQFHNTRLDDTAKFRVEPNNDYNKFGDVILDSLLEQEVTSSPLDQFQSELHKHIFGHDNYDNTKNDPSISNYSPPYKYRKPQSNSNVHNNNENNKITPYKNQIKNTQSHSVYTPPIDKIPLNTESPTSKNIRQKLILPTKYKNHITFSDNPKSVDHSKLSNNTKLIVPTKFKDRVTFSDAPPVNGSKIITGMKREQSSVPKPVRPVVYQTTTPMSTKFVDYTRSSSSSHTNDFRDFSYITLIDIL